MMEIGISEYREEDKEACIQLLKKAFPGSSDEKTFAWRFECLKTHKPLMVCAKCNDEVVGFHSWIPWVFSYGNKKYVGYQGGEAATEPQHRRKGIQNRIVNYACQIALDRDVDFLFGVGGSVGTYKALCNSGFYPVAFFPLRQRIVNPALKKGSEGKIVGTKQALNMMIREEKKITPIVDENYLEWRYSANPKDYCIFGVEKDNNQALFCIRKRRRRDKKFRITTSDLLVLDCQFSTLNHRFIKWAFKSLEGMYSRNVSTISTFFGENTDRGRAIGKQFYIKRESDVTALTVRPIKKSLDLNLFLNHNNWDVLPHIVDWW